MSGTRDENTYMARLAEQSERYEDMVTYMTRVACMGSELNVEERNLLSVAFKNAVGARRQAWRSIQSMMLKEDPSNPHLPRIQQYKQQVEQELNGKCQEILNLLKKEGGLILTSSNYEAQVFYLKMEGDYHRYLAEFSGGAEQELHGQNALTAYSQATTSAEQLAPTHPIRLGLALNFSVFYYEVYSRAEEACKLARAAFDAAVPTIGTLPDDQRKDSEAILALLRDNLNLWTEAMQAGADGKPPEQDGTLCEDL